MANPEQDMLFTDDIDGVHIRDMLQKDRALLTALGGFAARRYSFGGDAYEKTGKIPEYPTPFDMAHMVSGWAAYYGAELTKVVILGWDEAKVDPVQVYGWMQGFRDEQNRIDESAQPSEVTRG